MIATALKIQNASAEALISNEVMEVAREVSMELCDGDYSKLNRIAELMFKYSATLSAMTATTVAYACLGNDMMNEIADEIREFETLTQQIEKENN
jgi:hypothetical protein